MSVYELSHMSNHESWKSRRKDEKKMGKRIRINGKLYESVSPRNRSRRLNEAKWHEVKKPYFPSYGEWEDLPNGQAIRAAGSSISLDSEAIMGGNENGDIEINITVSDNQGNELAYYKIYRARNFSKAEKEFDQMLDMIDDNILPSVIADSFDMHEKS